MSLQDNLLYLQDEDLKNELREEFDAVIDSAEEMMFLVEDTLEITIEDSRAKSNSHRRI